MNRFLQVINEFYEMHIDQEHETIDHNDVPYKPAKKEDESTFIDKM